MALVNCPECGKKISDKATACIHCGYPIETTNADTDTNGITALFSQFALTATIYTKVADIYPNVLSEVSKVKNTNSAQKANDIIARSIIDGIIQIPSHIGWADTKLYCELINFETLSPDAIEYFADKLFSVISMKKYYDDGSGGYNNITQYYYAEYMVMQYASESTKAKYLTVLNTPYMGRQTAYEYIVSMYCQNAGKNTMSQISDVRQFSESIGSTQGNGLKCPVCCSTNIKKISSMGRFASVATFGLASSKIGKQYECKNCKHKW